MNTETAMKRRDQRLRKRLLQVLDAAKIRPEAGWASGRFLYDVVDPYLRLFRRFIPQLNMGGLGLDLSPIFAILVLYAIYAVVQRLIELAH